MTDRVIDIAEQPARLRIDLDRLVVEPADQPPTFIPLDEMGVLVIGNPAVQLTQAVLARLAARGAPVIVCDEKHSPCGMVMPLHGHHLQAERFDRQAHATLPVRKRLWKQLIRAKVRAQGRLLHRLGGDDAGLFALAADVRSGDPANIEAQAARRYWPALFGPEFRRDPDRPDQNRHLNYGYAVLRALVTRAICAAGLHPSLGLHHHNQYDAFCLASDLTEPFRPLVDERVWNWVRSNDPAAKLDPRAKAPLLAILNERYAVNGERRTLFDVLTIVATSLAAAFEGTRKELVLPEV